MKKTTKAIGTESDNLKDKKKVNSNKNHALNFLLLSAGSIFTSMMIAGFLVGFAVDSFFDTLPIFLLLCGVLGFIGGMLKVNKLLGNMDLLEGSKNKSDIKR